MKVVPDFLSSDQRAASQSFRRPSDQTFDPLLPRSAAADHGSKPGGWRDFRSQGHEANRVWRGGAGGVLGKRVTG
jgi:hypothetical protein